MKEHQNVTATMPMKEYLELAALKDIVYKLTEITKIAPGIASATDQRRGYGVKYSGFESLEEACNAARKAMGFQEI